MQEWFAISFSRGIFPTQGSNRHLLHWQIDSLPLSHQGYSLAATDSEESKLLHFVRFREKTLWKSPDLTPPPVNQSEPLASLGNSNQAWERRTNQNSTPNPSPEGDQSDPEIPIFRTFPSRIPYISNVTQSSGLLPIAAALVSVVSVGAPARAW